MRKAASSLVFFLLLACGGESKIPDSGKGSAAASGEDASGGSGANHGGGTNTGGDAESGGTSAGGQASGGSSRGGASAGGATATGGSRSGEGGEAGEPAPSGGAAGTAMAGNAGQSGGSGGATAGAGGRNPSDAECDPAEGELDATPYPDCEPRDSSDGCELCIQAECCSESKICYGYYPGNVCGWGGPTTGSYSGFNEIECYVACVRDYVTEFGVYDDAADTACIPACTTPECGLIGNATQDLVVCLRAHCDDECFVP